MALALDGSVTANITSGSSTSVTLSTSNANDVIVACVTVNNTTVSSISSSNTTGWTLRKRQVADAGNYIEEWAGTASSALSSESITITLAGSTVYCTITVFGISGADTTTKWDSNAALPDGGTTGARSITTSNADDFLIGAYRFATTASPTAGASWTTVAGANYQLVEYRIVAATQTGLTVPISTGNGDQNGGIGDAIIIASSGSTASTSASAAGAANATASGASLAGGNASSSGVSSATGRGASIAASAMSAAGTSVGTMEGAAVSASGAEAAISAAGASTAQAGTAAIAATAMSANGTSTARMVGTDATPTTTVRHDGWIPRSVIQSQRRKRADADLATIIAAIDTHRRVA